MSAIHDLIGQISDPRLRERLAAEWKAASTGRKFGLVFEDHLPELLPLPKAKPRRGDLVCRRQGALKEVWQVKSVKDGVVTCVKPQDETHPSEPTRATAETVNFAADELLVVREFGEPIFPSLVPVDAVANGPADAPWQTLIEADNYHALQLLDYLYAGKVDCIYIDPPYNTGASDWKYNNDYVDKNDQWRHSKWLAFMDRRLALAKRLLNPAASVLIVTIDEKEVLRLGILLEQIFPGCKVQKTTIVINPKGTARYNEFARVEEYAFFVFIGDIKICPFGSDLLTSRDYSSETHVRWRGLARTGRKGLRSNNPGSWYPIFLRTSDYTIHSIGDPLPDGEVESSVKVPKGTIAIWPPSKNGKQYSWGTVPATLRQIWSKGGFKTGIVKPEKQQFPFYYLSPGLFQKIENGQISVIGRGSQNELLLEYVEGQKQAMPRSVWNRVEYDAGSHGTGVLQSILGDSSFPFPKSLYAVRDSIRLFMEKRKDALILDFFAGSGTTLNAVNLLNAADGGQRRCILVTNNEVSAEEATALSARGLQPGDDDWEALGICRSVTWPRSKFTILGKRDDGALLSGEYLTGKVVEKEKARAFTQIGFVDPTSLDTPAKKKQVTTLMLMLACIRDRVTDDKLKGACREMLFQEENKWKKIPGRNRIVYDIRDNVSTFIESYIKTDDGSQSPDLAGIAASKNLSLSNMAAGLQTIHASFDDATRFPSAADFDRFVGYLLNNALFIYVSTEDLDDAFRLFTILNDRGIPLSNSDILKAKNLGAIVKESERTKWAEYWEEVEDEMGRDEFDRFLSLVRTIYVKDKAREGLLKEFDERIYGAKPPLLALGADSFEAVKAYKDAFDEAIQFDGLPPGLGNAYRNRINVMRRGLPATDWIPPVLAWYRKFKAQKLLDLIERIDNKFSADWIVQLTPTQRISNMNEVLKAIEAAKTPDDVLASKVFDFEHKQLLDLLDGAIYGRRFARYVLLRLEYLLASHAAPLNLPDEISVEHILPQNPDKASQWVRDFTEVQREEWLHRLGNLMLLSRRKNTSMGNLDFTAKRDRYFADRVENLPNSVGVLKLTDFKPVDLDVRHKELLAKLADSYV